MIKKLLAVVVSLVLVVVIAAVVLAFVFAGQGLSYLAKVIIERGGSYALGVPTTVDVVTVDTTQGSLDLDTLSVANPEGFSASSFLALSDAGFTVEPDTLFRETIEIPALALDGIDLSLERSASGANYDVILANVKRFESADPSAQPADPAASTRTFIINELAIRNVTVNARLLGTGNEAIDDAGEVSLEIPEIVLNDIGSAADPITMGELASLVVKTIITASLEVGGTQLPDLIAGDLRGRLSDLLPLSEMGVGSLGELLENPEGAVRDAVEDAAREAEDAIRRGLDNLLNPDRDEEQPRGE